MMHGSLLGLLGFAGALVLAGGCADGDSASGSGFSISGLTNVTQGTNPTASAGSTGTPTSSGAESTGTGSSSDPGTTDPLTTSGVDPSTTTTTTDPSTTTTGLPSTTSTTDPSTTSTTDPSTTSTTTGDPPPPPPPKDPQPVNGLYEACLDNTPCDLNLTDGCFTLTDANMNVTDGYCTLLCNVVGDCGAKPTCPAVQECLAISADQKVCALKCTGVKDCPTGMACINITLPNNGSGMYCF